MSKYKEIDVVDEARIVYFSRWKQLPNETKEEIQAHMLDTIYEKMVVPAIERAISLDRFGRGG